ncbi:hypothetical protein P378_08230 [Desulforamulus profundi]|uniref:Transposase IS4-like domain-containing protein n=1 Tax=Desulforamulus profundi TaxID=1383067 RepID=A0A2C6M8W1_9FIRM|nr:hypothetical protein P378_08230 [Desulforamulus profundi]
MSKVLYRTQLLLHRPNLDKTQMDAPVIEENDVLNVFDRGYVDYKKLINTVKMVPVLLAA